MAAAGRDQGKNHPTCLKAVAVPAVRPRYVMLLPITHTPPAGDTLDIEIPARVRQALRLDNTPSWVIVSEHSIDEWPNGGLSPLPEKAGHPQLQLYLAKTTRTDRGPLPRTDSLQEGARRAPACH